MGRRICACFSKSRYSVKKALSPPQGDQRRKKDAFEMFSASPIFYAWEAAYLDSQHLIPAMLNTLIIVLALLLKAFIII